MVFIGNEGFGDGRFWRPVTLIISLTTVQGLKMGFKILKNRETGACSGVGPTGPWTAQRLNGMPNVWTP